MKNEGYMISLYSSHAYFYTNVPFILRLTVCGHDRDHYLLHYHTNDVNTPV